jgi:PPK2 family polyphosphate:nucleotide phosphotransferase
MAKHFVQPGSKIDLSKRDTDGGGLAADAKERSQKDLELARRSLESLQETLFAEHVHKILIILQGMDTSGKDGVIRHVFEGVNPQGVRVAAFKEPSSTEIDHDYLWRIHREAPGRGEIAIFNRSHYEDVLVVRVHGGISQTECERRYRQINDFERMLSEEGTVILKFFLHVSKGEQKKRLEERLSDPRKHWKLSYSDVHERARWNDYTKAYEELLEKTSTEAAPWHVIPSDRKWYRNLVIAQEIVSALEKLRLSYPPSTLDLSAINLD